MLEDYWVDCADEFESREKFYSRLTVQQIKLYNVDIDVDGVKDDGLHMQTFTYLKRSKGTPIDSTTSNAYDGKSR